MKVPIGSLTTQLIRYWRLVVEVVVIGGLVTYGACQAAKYGHEKKLYDKSRVELQQQIARLNGALEGKMVRKVEPKNPVLKKFAQDERKAGAVPIVSSDLDVKIEDTAKSVNGPGFIEDEYGRFHFDLPSGLLTRKQSLKISSVIVRSPDGKYEFTKNDIREYSPKTGEEIPTTGLHIAGSFEFQEETAEAPKPKLFHPRLIALVDHRASAGVGAEFLNIKDRVTLGAAATYNGKDRKVDLALFPSVRLLNSNVSVGVSYSPFTHSLAGVATFQLTR